jgi:hypothetical protein
VSTTYPASLPRPQRDGYRITVTPASTTTTRDRSPDRVRVQGQGSMTVLDLVFVYTDAQFPVFKDWWRNDLQNGSLQATIQLRNGLADTPCAVQFLGEAGEEDLKGAWKVTLRAWVLAPPRLTAGDL